MAGQCLRRNDCALIKSWFGGPRCRPPPRNRRRPTPPRGRRYATFESGRIARIRRLTSGTAACLLPLRLFGDHGAFDPVLRVIALADSCRGERPLDHISSEMLRAANDPNRPPFGGTISQADTRAVARRPRTGDCGPFWPLVELGTCCIQDDLRSPAWYGVGAVATRCVVALPMTERPYDMGRK